MRVVEKEVGTPTLQRIVDYEGDCYRSSRFQY
jgi:hypothetical protein